MTDTSDTLAPRDAAALPMEASLQAAARKLLGDASLMTVPYNGGTISLTQLAANLLTVAGSATGLSSTQLAELNGALQGQGGDASAVSFTSGSTVRTGSSVLADQVADEAGIASLSSGVSSNTTAIGTEKTRATAAETALSNEIANLPAGGAAPIASTSTAGVVKPDGVTITVAADGTEKATGVASSVAAGTDISQTDAVATFTGAVARTEQQRASDVLSIAELGGKQGDAVSATKAFNLALAYAAKYPGTMIYFGPGNWKLTSPGLGGFPVPSSTVVSGAGRDATFITWNDDAANVNLFTAALVNNAASNITFQNFTVTGQWATLGNATDNGGYPFQPYNVNALTFDHLAVLYSRVMSIVARQSQDVTASNCRVAYSGRDAINFSSCTNMSVTDNVIEHTDDDGIALHSASSDDWGVRRDMVVTGNRLFDTQEIRLLSARSAVVSGNLLDSVKQAGINVQTVGASGSTSGLQEGVSAGSAIVITNNVITNVVNRGYVDNVNGGCDYILITGDSSRAGNYGAVPGLPAAPGSSEAAGTIHSPYNEFMANSQLTTVATDATAGIIIKGNYLGRTLPGCNGADSRYKQWTDFQQGTIFSRKGFQNPSMAVNGLYGVGIHVYDGVIRNTLIEGNQFVGLYYTLELEGGQDLGDYDFRNNLVVDSVSHAIYLNANNTKTRARVTATGNTFDLDPFFSSTGRGSNGRWSGAGPYAFYNNASPAMTLTAIGNTIRNAYGDTNLATDSPTSGNLFRDNTNEANPVTVNGAASTANEGMSVLHLAGFKVLQLGSDPTLTNYGTVLSVPIEAAASQPTTGFWVQGAWVRNSAPSSSNTALGWLRLTTGSGNANGTDWLAK